MQFLKNVLQPKNRKICRNVIWEQVYYMNYVKILGVGGVAIAFVLGSFFGAWFFKGEYRECKSRYAFINTSYVCGEAPVLDKTGYEEFKSDLIAQIEKEKAKGRVTRVAVYFRDLKNGPIFGIRENDDYAPASLLKLPLVLMFYNLEETAPGFLQKQIPYIKRPSVIHQTIAPSVTITENRSYTLQELVANTLEYSDNASYELLLQYLNTMEGGDKIYFQTFQDLGIIDPKSSLEQTLSVRGYSTIFRILYNSSYLNAELSEKVLDLLTKSDYKKGLVAGVPSTVRVAHKFGERVVIKDGTTMSFKQLHDCGIVYYPGNPYTLCVMTVGQDLDEMAGAISDISKSVYEEVDSRKLEE